MGIVEKATVKNIIVTFRMHALYAYGRPTALTMQHLHTSSPVFSFLRLIVQYQYRPFQAHNSDDSDVNPFHYSKMQRHTENKFIYFSQELVLDLHYTMEI